MLLKEVSEKDKYITIMLKKAVSFIKKSHKLSYKVITYYGDLTKKFL